MPSLLIESERRRLANNELTAANLFIVEHGDNVGPPAERIVRSDM